jgi:hypothetical protein
MARFFQGVFTPPAADVSLEGVVFNYWPIKPHIVEIRQFAGMAYGTATICYPAHYAADAEPQMGKGAVLRLDNKVVFRGIVADGPFAMNAENDEVQLLLLDDKWRMASTVVGQIGIGTQGDPAGSEGFKDVAFELVFNRDGRPNKDPAAREFNTGSGAVYWTLSDVMRWLFDYYIPSSVVTLDADLLSGDGYARIPSNLNLMGQQAHQAVDTVAQLAGESWGLIPGNSASAFIPIRAGSGTRRNVYLIAPRTGRRATEANRYYATSCNVPKNLRDSRDVYQAVSSPIVKESTYTSAGENPLLVLLAGFKDKEYEARYKVDVTKYLANNLGANLSSGSRPKRMLQNLCTRLNTAGTAYLTAAEIAATPALQLNERLKKPFVWVSLTGAEADAQLCVEGHRLDLENGLLDFESRIGLLPDAGAEPDQITVVANGRTWASVHVWLTAATVLEMPAYAQSSAERQYLPMQAYQVLQRTDLVPERRQNVWLPDLDGNNNAVSKILAGPEDEEEKYVDVDDRLSEAVASAIDSTPDVATPVELDFAFVPLFDLGDRIAMKGRQVGASGDEVVVEIAYQFLEGTPTSTHVRATNVLGAMDPEQFVEAA